MLLAITAPALNNRGPRSMQSVFAALRQSLRPGDVVQLEYGCLDGHVGIFCRVPAHLEYRLTRLLQSKYPNCQLRVVDDRAIDLGGSDQHTVSAELTLEPSLFPLLRFEQFESLLERKLDDPMELLFSAVAPDQTGVRVRIEIAITPTSKRQNRSVKRLVKRLDQPFFRMHFDLSARYARCALHPWRWPVAWPLRLLAAGSARGDSKTDTTAGRQGDRTDDVQAAADKIGGHLYNARIRLVVSAFKKLYDSWGPRLEDTLPNSTYITVQYRGTLLSLLRVLSDDAFRDRVLAHNPTKSPSISGCGSCPAGTAAPGDLDFPIFLPSPCLCYNADMSTSSPVEFESSILQRLVADDQSLGPEAAQFILSLKFPDNDQKRMHELAQKARQGTLSPDERAEAEGYERVGALLGMLKSKARLALQRSANNADQSESP